MLSTGLDFSQNGKAIPRMPCSAPMHPGKWKIDRNRCFRSILVIERLSHGCYCQHRRGRKMVNRLKNANRSTDSIEIGPIDTRPGRGAVFPGVLAIPGGRSIPGADTRPGAAGESIPGAANTSPGRYLAQPIPGRADCFPVFILYIPIENASVIKKRFLCQKVISNYVYIYDII